jgi:hypothetical protein
MGCKMRMPVEGTFFIRSHIVDPLDIRVFKFIPFTHLMLPSLFILQI